MRRDWRFDIEVDRDLPLPPFVQIARALTDDIRRGRLRPRRSAARQPRSGGRRPRSPEHGPRRLRGARRRGMAGGGHGRGTFVAPTIPESKRAQRSERTRARRRAAARRILRAGRAGGVPAARPSSRNAEPQQWRAGSAAGAGHGDRPRVSTRPCAPRRSAARATAIPKGHPALRAALASMLAATRALPDRRGGCVRDARQPDGALARRARAAAAPATSSPSRASAIARPGRRSAPRARASCRCRSMRAASTSTRWRALHDRTPVRAVYLTPHHQYPTTVTLTRRAASRSSRWRGASGSPIVEDDYDHEFHYEGRPVLPLASADPARVVIYVGTLSKVLAPGLRLGYVVAPPDVMQRITAIRSLLDIQGDLAMEAAVAELIEDGELQRHVARARRIYAERRERSRRGDTSRARRRRGIRDSQRRDGVVGEVHLAGEHRALGAAQRRSRRLVAHRPALRLRSDADTLRPTQLRLAERTRAAGSGTTPGGRTAGGIAQPSQVLTAKACPLSRRSASAGNRSKPAN